MIIYISGPISLGGTASEEVIEDNINKFKRIAYTLRQAGHTIHNPVEIPEQGSWQAYMKLCIPLVCESELVAVLPQWETSRGALTEAFVANLLGIPIKPVEKVI